MVVALEIAEGMLRSNGAMLEHEVTDLDLDRVWCEGEARHHDEGC